MKPTLSIVIPTLNEEGFIEKLIESIIDQNPHNKYETIIADSGSSDNTCANVEEYIKKFPKKNIRLVHAPKKGVSIARNTGAAHARGKYILFLDADTRIPANFIKNALNEIQERKLDSAGCPLKPYPERLVDKAVFSFYQHCVINPLQYTKRPGSAGAGIIVKKNIHEKVNGFDINMEYCEDLYYLKALSMAGKFRILKSTNILFNTRRFDEEGRARVWFKYIVWGSCYLFNVKSVEFEYEFGKFSHMKGRIAQPKNINQEEVVTKN